MPFARDKDSRAFPLVAARSAARRTDPAAVFRPLGVVRGAGRAAARGLRAAALVLGRCGLRGVGGGVDLYLGYLWCDLYLGYCQLGRKLHTR